MNTLTIPETELDSSVLTAARYDASRRVLELDFASGRSYAYSDVPATVASELLVAESKGRYFNNTIKDRYPFRRIR